MAGAKGVKQKHRLHGLVALRRALKGSIRPGSKLGVVLAEMRAAHLADLGVSADRASEAQRALVELAVRTHVRWASTEAWLDKHLSDNPEALLDARILAIVREGRAAGSALADHLLAMRDPRLARKPAEQSWEAAIAAACAEPDDHDDQDGAQDAQESHASLDESAQDGSEATPEPEQRDCPSSSASAQPGPSLLAVDAQGAQAPEPAAVGADAVESEHQNDDQDDEQPRALPGSDWAIGCACHDEEPEQHQEPAHEQPEQ